jgi:hypothetical protein
MGSHVWVSLCSCHGRFSEKLSACGLGHARGMSNMYICMYVDIDECEANNGGCEQRCTNGDGSFQCSCEVGYTLATNNLGCNGKTGFCRVTNCPVLVCPDVLTIVI